MNVSNFTIFFDCLIDKYGLFNYVGEAGSYRMVEFYIRPLDERPIS